jgi:hypothetical protein
LYCFGFSKGIRFTYKAPKSHDFSCMTRAHSNQNLAQRICPSGVLTHSSVKKRQVNLPLGRDLRKVPSMGKKRGNRFAFKFLASLEREAKTKRAPYA